MSAEPAPAFDEDRATIQRVLTCHPDLSRDGFGHYWSRGEAFRASQARMLTPDGIEEFRAARDFLFWRCAPRRTINRRLTSYRLKHLAERGSDHGHVSNGALIAAAIALGFKVLPIDGVPNAWLNVSLDRRAS